MTLPFSRCGLGGRAAPGTQDGASQTSHLFLKDRACTAFPCGVSFLSMSSVDAGMRIHMSYVRSFPELLGRS
jgi:hypothetical protein